MFVHSCKSSDGNWRVIVVNHSLLHQYRKACNWWWQPATSFRPGYVLIVSQSTRSKGVYFSAHWGSVWIAMIWMQIISDQPTALVISLGGRLEVMLQLPGPNCRCLMKLWAASQWCYIYLNVIAFMTGQIGNFIWGTIHALRKNFKWMCGLDSRLGKFETCVEFTQVTLKIIKRVLPSDIWIYIYLRSTNNRRGIYHTKVWRVFECATGRGISCQVVRTWTSHGVYVPAHELYWSVCLGIVLKLTHWFWTELRHSKTFMLY